MTVTHTRSRVRRRPEGEGQKLLLPRPAALKALDAKGEQPGTFEAIVSVFNNVDHYGERVLPGAFRDTLKSWRQRGDPIPIIFSHDWRDPRSHIGKALDAKEVEAGLWIKGLLDIHKPPEVSHARQIYDLMSERRVTQFSFAYDETDSGWASMDEDEEDYDIWDLRKLDLFEVGPCLVGVNPATELLDLKAYGAKVGRVLSAANESKLRDARDLLDDILAGLGTEARAGMGKAAIPSHTTATEDGTWDGAANEAHLSNDAESETYRKAYAWVDPTGDDDTKAAYRFIHHFVSTEGAVGAASTVAASAGIAVLNGGRGGTTIPGDDKSGVYGHLRKHLLDSGREPDTIPELKATSEGQVRGADRGPQGKVGQDRGAGTGEDLLLRDALASAEQEGFHSLFDTLGEPHDHEGRAGSPA